MAINLAGEVFSTLGLPEHADGIGIVKKFFVRADWRACKVGFALYQQLESHCAREGIHTLVLDTPSVAKDSHRFYERNGFVKVEPSELPVPYVYPDRDSHVYMKSL